MKKNILENMIKELVSSDFVLNYVAKLYAEKSPLEISEEDTEVAFYYELRANRPAPRTIAREFEKEVLYKYYDTDLSCTIADVITTEERGELVWQRSYLVK